MIDRRPALAEEILDFAEHGDYSNGIVGNDGTIDQGNVYARERIKEFRDRLNKLRSLESQCENIGHCGSTEGCGAEEIPALPNVEELDGLLLTISGVSDLKPAERKEAAAVIVDWLLSRRGQSAKPEWERAVDDFEARLKLELYSITMEYLKPHLAQMRSRLTALSGSSRTVSQAEWDDLCLYSRNGVVILSAIREWLQSIGHPVEDAQ